jgi:hypothetical protein
VLSARYNTTHGASLAIVMPAFMRRFWKTRPQRYMQFAERIFALAAELSPNLETFLDDALIELPGADENAFFADLDEHYIDRAENLGVQNHRFRHGIAVRYAFGQGEKGFTQPRLQSRRESIQRTLHRHTGIEHIRKIVISNGKAA